jgi:hypothetical protein
VAIQKIVSQGDVFGKLTLGMWNSRISNANISNVVLGTGASANVRNTVNYKYPSISLGKLIKGYAAYEISKTVSKITNQTIERGLNLTKSFSPEVSAAQAEAQIMQTMANIRSAQVYGPDLAESVRQRARLSAAWQGLTDPFWKGFYRQTANMFEFGANIIEGSGLLESGFYNNRLGPAVGAGASAGLLAGSSLAIAGTTFYLLKAGALYLAGSGGAMAALGMIPPVLLTALAASILIGGGVFAYKMLTGSGQEESASQQMFLHNLLPPVPEVPKIELYKADPVHYDIFGLSGRSYFYYHP